MPYKRGKQCSRVTRSLVDGQTGMRHIPLLCIVSVGLTPALEEPRTSAVGHNQRRVLDVFVVADESE